MRRSMTALLIMLALLDWAVPARAYNFQYTDSSSNLRIKWPSPTITIAFSTSLNQPPSNIKAGSDVPGAVRRALSNWSQNSDIRFIETASSAQSVSAPGNGDHISLITVADTPENAALFPPCGNTEEIRTGRARVFYNPDTGEITEADIAINPCLQFSTDGSSGTYDLEATLTHELGHLLGLDHSSVTGATMHPRQGQNGLYDLPALTLRTLAEDDRAGVRALYGSHSGMGAIAGRLRAETPMIGARIWAENTETRQLVAGRLTPEDAFRIDDLPPGDYRVMVEPLESSADTADPTAPHVPELADMPTAPVRATELSGRVTVTAETTTTLDVSNVDSQTPTINPRLFGINNQLSTIPVPLSPGKSYKLYVSGEGLDKVRAQGVAVTSPYFSINPDTFMQQDFGTGLPVITFDVMVAPDTPAGDYSLQLTGRGNEVGYLLSALTIDRPAAALTAPPIDEAQLFVHPPTLALIHRAPDADGYQFWPLAGNNHVADIFWR